MTAPAAADAEQAELDDLINTAAKLRADELAAEKPADKKPTKAAVKRVTYACDGGVTMTVTYPPEAQAKTGRVKIAMKETTYFVRPAGPDKWENKNIKLVFQPKGEEATIEQRGVPMLPPTWTSRPARSWLSPRAA